MSIQPVNGDRYHLKPLGQTSSTPSYLSHLTLGLRRAPDEYNKYFNDLTRLRFVDGRFLTKGKNLSTNQFIER